MYLIHMIFVVIYLVAILQNVGLFLVLFIPFGHHVKIPMNWLFKARLLMFLIAYVSGYCVNYNTIIGALWTRKPNSLRCQYNSMPCFFFKGPPGILFERNLCWLLPFQQPFRKQGCNNPISTHFHLLPTVCNKLQTFKLSQPSLPATIVNTELNERLTISWMVILFKRGK